MNDKGSPLNLLKYQQFKKSREVLSARKKQLVVENAKGNRPQASRELTAEEEDELFRLGEFGDSNPEALQRTVWWLLSLHFGFRARDESRRLKWGDVKLCKDPTTGNEFLLWEASLLRRGFGVIEEAGNLCQKSRPIVQNTGGGEEFVRNLLIVIVTCNC